MRKKPKVYYTPTTQVTLSYQKKMTEMSDKEAESYLQDVRNRLIVKMQREKSYLDRRAARGTDTPTDEAYRNDQILEREIIAIIDDLLQGIGGRNP